MRWARGLFLVSSFLVSSAAAARAQTGRITGTISDSATAQPLASANVQVVGTTIGAATGPDGRFVIPSAPAGTHTLRFTRIGYGPRTRQVTVTDGQATTADIALATQAVQLSTVVSIGYGTTTQRNVTGSVATVQTEALEKAPIATIDQMLQGTAPGVQVTTASNEPGGALSIRIRGASSITGNAEPLYVIDGFPIENDIEAAAVGNAGRSRTTPPNPMSTLNPSDIESISILKDASATAIYGARGANGVVIITTRQGRGTKPQFTLDYYTGAQSVAKTYDMLNAAEYMQYANEFGQNSSTQYTPFPDTTMQRILADPTLNVDWQDEIFRTGATKNLQLSVRGATQATSPTRYALSAGMFDTDGIVLGSGLSRYSTRVNLNQSIGSRVELGGNFSGAQARSKSVPTGGQQNANAGAVSAAIQYVPVIPVRWTTGPNAGRYSYINRDLNAYSTLLDAPQTPNPVSLAQEVKDSLSDTRLLGNLFAEASLVEGLKLRVSGGADYANRWRYTYYPRTTLRGEQSNGEAIRASSVTSSWLNENTLTYQRQLFRVHDLDLLAGYTRQRTDVDGDNMTNTNFVSDITGYFDIGAGTQEGGPSVSSRRTTQTLESFLGRVNYSLLDRYLLTMTARRDGSSRFAAGRKWGWFPSAALGWRASAEPWFPSFGTIDELKFRASYGIVGNPSIRPYQSLSRLNDQGYSFGGTPLAGYYPTAVGNPNLTWESTRQVDLGFDLGLADRFTVTADYYKKRTTDLLLNVRLPMETGFQSALANRGVVDNAGFELGVDARIFDPAKEGGFAWRANVNYARNKNKVVSLGGPEYIEADLITTDYNLPGSRIWVGKPLGVFYGFRSEGVIRDAEEAGKIYWKNFNNAAFTEGSMKVIDVDDDSVITLNDRTDIGNPNPDFTLGLTNTLSFRGFELTGLLQGQYGGEVLNVNRIRTESSPRVNIARDRYYDRWTPENRDAKYPKLGDNPNQVGTNNITSNLLEDASYLRLRTLTLSYGLPSSLTQRYRISGARLYVTGTNLFTVTDYSGFDPDVSSQSVGAQNRGIDIGAYPLARGFTMGLTFTY